MRLYMRSADRRPDPPPMPTDDRRVILVGVVVWAVLLVVAVAARGELSSQGHGWWVWTPVTGVALGLYGLRYLRKHDSGQASGREGFVDQDVDE